MARQKSENTDRISFKIDPELFDKFHWFAFDNDVSMAEVYRDALRQYAEIHMPDPEETEEFEARLAQVRAERQHQEAITALPLLEFENARLPN